MSGVEIIIMLGIYIMLYLILVLLIWSQRDNQVKDNDICWYSGLPSTKSYYDHMDE